MKTKLFSFFFALCYSLSAFAYDALIDGIYYNLNSTDLTAEVTNEIGDYWAESYSGSVSIPETVTYSNTTYRVTTIGNEAFSNCSGLTSVTIPNSVTTIGYDAFGGCYGLTSVTIPNSVTTIGYGAFGGCYGLTKTNYTGTIADWCKIKFYSDSTSNPICRSHNFFINDVEVKDLVIDNVDMIGNYTFYGCDGLTSVTIGNSVTTIGDEAFFYCRGLTSVTIGNSVTTIGYYAFYGCDGLTSVTIGNSVATIGNNAFYGCDGLTSIDVAAANTHYASIDGVLFNYAKDTLIQYPNGNSRTEYTIPNSVTTIGEDAFEYCRGLTSVTIGNSVTTIGDEAFFYCRGLTSLTCEATTPPTCRYYCFYGVDKSIPLYVPAGSIDAYKAANQWKDFTNIQAIVDWDDNHPDNPGFYEIAVSASPQEGGIVSGGGLYADGDTVTISAIANDGYEFVDWSNGCLTNSQDIVLHSRDTALIANFKRTVLDTVIISDEQSISTLPVGAITHVIVRETGKLNLDQATEIRSLTLHQCGNQAAQVTHIERLNDCMVDMVIHLEPAAANAIPNKWYAFAVPFDVDTNSGIRRDGATQVAVPGVDFQIDEYDGALRASTQQGWKRNTDTLKPGKFFMFATNSTANDWRFTKTPDSTLMEQSLITVAEYPAAKKHHAGWNGLSNTLFENANAVCENLTYATIYNNPTNTYQTVLFDSYTFCPTQPFLVQVETQSVVELQPLDILQAPAREVETSITTLSLCQVMENKVPSVDYAYFTITDEETTEYVIGKDLLKMKTANSVVPQIWINAYNLQLAAHEVQMENNMLALALGLYAPNNGEYILRSDNMAISVLCNGVALPAYSDAQGLFWKLNMIQGTNENYSVSIKNLPTAIDQTDNTSINSHKFIKNNHLYILRDGNLYTATGARVK